MAAMNDRGYYAIHWLDKLIIIGWEILDLPSLAKMPFDRALLVLAQRFSAKRVPGTLYYQDGHQPQGKSKTIIFLVLALMDSFRGSLAVYGLLTNELATVA